MNPIVEVPSTENWTAESSLVEESRILMNQFLIEALAENWFMIVVAAISNHWGADCWDHVYSVWQSVARFNSCWWWPLLYLWEFQ